MLTERAIVITEDNPVLRSLLTEIFRECGWRARPVGNGFASLQAITEGAPAILLSDLEMDGMSNFEMLSIVCRRFASIKVAAMSGASSGTDVPAGSLYAKGGSVSTLLDLVAELGGKQLADLRRTESPAWLPFRIALSTPDGCPGVACLNCVRLMFLDSTASESGREFTCPYCHKTVRVLFSDDSATKATAGVLSRALPAKQLRASEQNTGGASC